MDRKNWKKKIKSQCIEANTYRKAFDPIIDSLSDVLEQRDLAYDDYVANGASPCIIRVSDRGAENIAKNPRLLIWIDLNNQALAYWKELGLTPQGLKKLNDDAMKIEKKTSFSEVLQNMGI